MSPTAYSPLGIKRMDDTKLKISNNSKGRIMSEETKRKISESNRGKKRNEESRIKMSIASKGKTKKHFYKKVYKICPITNNIIDIFDCVNNAANNVGAVSSNITRCLKNEKFTCKRFKWQYV